MVNNFDVDKRISISTMGRPYIYFDVLVALRKQADNGNLIMDQSSDIMDCVFYMNPYQEELKNNAGPTTTRVFTVLTEVKRPFYATKQTS